MRKHDHPFDEVLQSVVELAAQGHGCYQKYTCANCGGRLSMDEPNKMWYEGTCDRLGCEGVVTNIKSQGCNFLLITNTRERLDTPLTVTVCKPADRPPDPPDP